MRGGRRGEDVRGGRRGEEKGRRGEGKRGEERGGEGRRGEDVGGREDVGGGEGRVCEGTLMGWVSVMLLFPSHLTVISLYYKLSIMPSSRVAFCQAVMCYRHMLSSFAHCSLVQGARVCSGEEVPQLAEGCSRLGRLSQPLLGHPHPDMGLRGHGGGGRGGLHPGAGRPLGGEGRGPAQGEVSSCGKEGRGEVKWRDEGRGEERVAEAYCAVPLLLILIFKFECAEWCLSVTCPAPHSILPLILSLPLLSPPLPSPPLPSLSLPSPPLPSLPPSPPLPPLPSPPLPSPHSIAVWTQSPSLRSLARESCIECLRCLTAGLRVAACRMLRATTRLRTRRHLSLGSLRTSLRKESTRPGDGKEMFSSGD